MNLRRGWLTALLLAFIVRALIPQGFMAGSSAQVPLVICSGHGLESPTGSTERPGQPTAKSDHVCPFAGFQALDPPAHLVITDSGIAWVASDQPRFAVIVFPGRGLAAPPPPSTASPRDLG